MNIETLIKELGDAAADIVNQPYDRSIMGTAVKLLRECHAAGFITDDGQARKVLGTLPVTADGCVIGHGALIHGFWDDGEPGWTSRSSVRVDLEDWDKPECGGFYSTRSAAEAAKENK